MWTTRALLLAISCLVFQVQDATASPMAASSSTAVSTSFAFVNVVARQRKQNANADKLDPSLDNNNNDNSQRNLGKGWGKGKGKGNSKKSAKSSKSAKSTKRSKSAKSQRSHDMKLTEKPVLKPTRRPNIKPTPRPVNQPTPKPNNAKPTPKPNNAKPTPKPTTQKPTLPYPSSVSPTEPVPTTQPTSVQDVICFTTPSQAMAIGTLVLKSLQYQLSNSACDPSTIAMILDKYFRDDIMVQYSNGTIAHSGIDAVKDFYIGTSAEPGPFRNVCAQSFSWTTMGRFTHPSVFNELVLAVNEENAYAGYSLLEQGRYFILELFNPNSAGPTLSDDDVAQSTGPSLPRQCRSPQIYGIVFQPTFQ